MITEEITGTGLTFPIQLENGKVNPKFGIDLLRSCIQNVLVHQFGKTYFQRNFGVGIEKYLDEPNDLVTERALNHQLTTQLAQWDKRITIDNLKAKREKDFTLTITIDVTLTGTDQTQQIIFPINTAVI